jgi:hypothetical protein
MKLLLNVPASQFVLVQLNAKPQATPACCTVNV